MARPRVPGARSKHNKFHNVIAGTVVLAVLLGTLSFVPRGLQIQRSHALGESGVFRRGAAREVGVTSVNSVGGWLAATMSPNHLDPRRPRGCGAAH